jgi:hypothetical protein
MWINYFMLSTYRVLLINKGLLRTILIISLECITVESCTYLM